MTSGDGVQFFAHKIILCAQSPVFNAMLASGSWKESSSGEATLTNVESGVMKYLLEFLYTGKCVFPRDNLL